MNDQEIDGLAPAEAEAMNEIADYCRRGRQYRDLSRDDSADLWIAALKAWLRSRSTYDARIESDARAELALRKIAPPWERVPDELKAMREETKTESAKRNLRAKLGKFLDELDGPQNRAV